MRIELLFFKAVAAENILKRVCCLEFLIFLQKLTYWL